MMESLLELLESLTQLISTVVVIVLFFLFVVCPFLKYLFVNYEIESRKKHNEERLAGDLTNGLGEIHKDVQEIKIAERKTFQSTRVSEKDAIGRLAASDPEKAGELVKKWINSE